MRAIPSSPTRCPCDSQLHLDGIERLERRAMLAGNVTARLTAGGDVHIIGDAADNDVMIMKDPGGAILVQGRSGTTVNGMNSQFLLTGEPVVEDDFVVRMRAGDDQVEIVGSVVVHGDIRISLGSGDDALGLFAVASAKSTQLVTGAGDDLVSCVATHVAGGSFRVVTGSGNDRMLFAQCSTSDVRTRISMGSGEDWLSFAGSAADAPTSVNMGGGTDHVAFWGGTAVNRFVKDARVNLGGGDDLVAFSTDAEVRAGRLIGGSGSDTARVDVGAFMDMDDTGLEDLLPNDPLANVAVSFSFEAFRVEYLSRGGSQRFVNCAGI